jgi:hypothetical protein
MSLLHHSMGHTNAFHIQHEGVLIFGKDEEALSVRRKMRVGDRIGQNLFIQWGCCAQIVDG